ncbi:5'-nucleotidase, lipoprotein e(P4) family [Gallaecimonas kandeliae]|uniref:5'-nucleotidase, lipoprotein e(P4) family n=1 Tax=Gallaecimonas kandeliae TaxID=3029055 RepID=UPI00264812B9|nr:5'-nucleotidase, lipoprotein e(P4) family [Gallaecimonas kandeliae]WKE65089.1 5'-nucleotidase, lipoprotein e(P4) family [Gallaecimonas kandeliae]
MNRFVLALPLLLAAAAPQAKTAPVDLQSQNTQAVLWMQDSGEYRALCYQAFNLAKLAFDQALANHQGKLAVMVDLDETMLDNSPYSAWQILGQQPYSDKSWDTWVNSIQTAALPGAVDFANHVTLAGGTVFYVSNRSARTFDATAKNLVQAGFPRVDRDTLRLKTTTSDKASRLAAIQAQGYQVVLMLGDNLNDFPELGTYHQQNAERELAVDAHQADFGNRFILLPNPSYGDWEPGLGKDYYQLNDAGKARLRQRSLRSWSGK